MGFFDKQKFASNSQEWATPDSVFIPLNDEFHFTLDVCATQENAKHSKFFSKEENALVQNWEKHICWMNPPFNELKLWVKKAFEEGQKENTMVVCLLPARTNTTWFHDYCLKGEVRFIKGRPKFNEGKHGLPQPLAIVIFR